MIATGHSQSANRLAVYHNRVHPLVRLADGFVIHGGGRQLDEIEGTRVLKINAETDLTVMSQFRRRQPDSEYLRIWEVAGAAHADHYYLERFTELAIRDLGSGPPVECVEPPLSRIPFRYVLHAGYDHLVSWIVEGVAPPAGPPIEMREGDSGVEVARDSLGNALGGIRLPPHAVPLAVNSGSNPGGGFCRFFGAHRPFEQATINALYPDREAYLDALRASVEANLREGFLVPADAEEIMSQADSALSGGIGEVR